MRTDTPRTPDYHSAVLGLDAKDYPREFRPDIQAMRALAVLLVVFWHAGIVGFHGGFLGVDVFFVVSGFVITNVLIDERAERGRASLLGFYARRIRRILPAATVVLIATIFFTYHYLSFITGSMNAEDAKYVAGFIGNFHFSAIQQGYFTSDNPHSTLLQYWSLAVEEQFYLVWPLLFVVFSWRSKHMWGSRAAGSDTTDATEVQGGPEPVESTGAASDAAPVPSGAVVTSVPPVATEGAAQVSDEPPVVGDPLHWGRLSVRGRLIGVLCAVIVLSLWYAIYETGQNPTSAFYSPFTRAWELALGCIIAVSAPWLRGKLPRIGLLLQVVGTGSVLVCTWVYTSATAATQWPGTAAIVPVVSAALIIAGGSLRGVERIGRFARFWPIQWIGNISFSLYLVHYPIIIIAEQYATPGTTLPWSSRLELALVAIPVAAILYYVVENPIRRARVLQRDLALTYYVGVLLVSASFAAIYWHLSHQGSYALAVALAHVHPAAVHLGLGSP